MRSQVTRHCWCGAALFVLVLAGCGSREELENEYGKRSGAFSSESVNGTTVLSDMIRARGHKVDTRRALTPKLREAEVIVWFPDNFSAPTKEVCDWFEEWLSEEPDRTLVYVGRDFDAAPLYWTKITPLAKPEIAGEVKRRKQAYELAHQLARSRKLDPAECRWFELSNDAKPRQAKKLSGPWSAGVDGAKAEIYLDGEFTPDNWVKPLLESGDDWIVSRYQLDHWNDSEVILIQNGSFLLNFGLVNRENRKLAAKLVDELGDRDVVFLETDRNGPKILNQDPTPNMGNGLEFLQVWPLSAILLHLAVLGIIFCFARFPIFGTPRLPAAEAVSDFGLHVNALGDLLAATRDRAYAEGRLAHYRDVRGDAR
jgi:hypothetical protein